MSSPAKDLTDSDEAEKKAEAGESRKRKQPDSEPSNDPNSPAKEGDVKNWKRIMANRKSARDSRLRRIKYMETLEKSVEELTRENTDLIRENQALTRDNFILRQQHGMGGGGGNVGMMDASAGRDEASYRQSGPPMGTRAGQGLLPGEGAARYPVGMSPSRTGIAASRSALTRPVLDMPHPGFDMPMEPSGFRSAMQTMPSSVPRPTAADQYGGTMDMIRNRRTQNMIPNPSIPSEEEQRVLNVMRRGTEPK